MGNSVPLPEIHLTQWYRQFDDSEVEKIVPSDLLDIESDNLIEKITPPVNRANRSCTVWLEVSDMFINEFHRPQGSTLKELYLQFEVEE